MTEVTQEFMQYSAIKEIINQMPNGEERQTILRLHGELKALLAETGALGVIAMSFLAAEIGAGYWSTLPGEVAHAPKQ